MARPAVSLSSLFYNCGPRPYVSGLRAARIVTNLLGRGNGSTTFGYDRYYKNAASSWGDFPTDTAAVTWGYNVDGGQWFEVATTAAGIQRAWASIQFAAVVGETYLISFTVDSKTGTHVGNNANTTGATTFAGNAAPLNNMTPGRYVIGGRCTVAGTCVVRLGIGVDAANAHNATMRFSNVMVERVPAGRTYPGEYVRPGDQRAFNYDMSAVVTSGAVGTPTLGTPYEVPASSSVMILGDSFANDPGDYPTWLRYFTRNKPVAVNGLGVAGAAISAITSQIATEAARRATSPTAVADMYCIAHGGVNDVNSNRTLAQMQADRLTQNAAIVAAGMTPLLLTTSPLNAASAAQQTVMDGYNTWIKTLGYPVYDLFTDASDGNGDFKASWGSGDGVHPGTGINQGFAVMGKRLADLIALARY